MLGETATGATATAEGAVEHQKQSEVRLRNQWAPSEELKTIGRRGKSRVSVRMAVIAQSSQSFPTSQRPYSEPGPPSSQKPSLMYVHESSQRPDALPPGSQGLRARSKQPNRRSTGASRKAAFGWLACTVGAICPHIAKAILRTRAAIVAEAVANVCA